MFKLVNKVMEIVSAIVNIKGEMKMLDNYKVKNMFSQFELEEIYKAAAIRGGFELLNIEQFNALDTVNKMKYKLKIFLYVNLESYIAAVRKKLNTIGAQGWDLKTVEKIKYLDAKLGGATEEELEKMEYVKIRRIENKVVVEKKDLSLEERQYILSMYKELPSTFQFNLIDCCFLTLEGIWDRYSMGYAIYDYLKTYVMCKLGGSSTTSI